LKSITIIANLNNHPQKIKNNIKLSGKFVKGDIWYQTNFSTPKGVMTEV